MEKGGVVQTEFEPLRSVENVFSSLFLSNRLYLFQILWRRVLRAKLITAQRDQVLEFGCLFGCFRHNREDIHIAVSKDHVASN